VIHSGIFVVHCDPEIAFDLLAAPERFAPLLPDFESMTMQDATHFNMRSVLAIGRINGHIDSAMELAEAIRPERIRYRGQGTVASSPLSFELEFRITPAGEMTEVRWQGEVKLSGSLAFMVGDLLDGMSRQNFERTAESLRVRLQELGLPPAPAESSSEFEI
jgi:carbon monoxide dehydrogenase subunit G